MNTNYQAVKEILKSKIAGGSINVVVAPASMEQIKEIGAAIRKAANVKGDPVIPDELFEQAKALADTFKTSYFRNNRIEDGVMYPTSDEDHRGAIEEISTVMANAPVHYIANALALVDIVVDRKELTFK